MEAFSPAAGTVVTFGYDELGGRQGVSVDVREIRDSKGATARGLVVDVRESEYRKERSFVDADEIAELLKAFDVLLDVNTNPTQFKNFEVQYKTRGGLEIVAFNNSHTGNILYAVRAGRTLTAESVGLSVGDMQNHRIKFVAAAEKLATLPKL